MDEEQTPPASGLSRHLRRYGAIYAIAAVIVVVAVVLPARAKKDSKAASAPAASAKTSGTTWAPASGALKAGTGTTRGGASCGAATRQIPDSSYALPCVAKFTGDNGGATARGVTADKIRVVVRRFPDTPNSLALQKQLQDAGFATQDVTDKIRDQFIDYFNKNYELYGRTVELVDYTSKFGDATAEALGGGREGACQDATQIADELKAFAVVGGSGVFSECAQERGLVVFEGGAYFSEGFYGRLAPYVYNTTMSCERISAHIAEYIGKRLANRPARWAGDPALATKTRKFGTYVPDNDEYQRCNKLTQDTLKNTYKLEPGLVVSYALDISKFIDQANRAIVQFKAEGVTTVVLASDPISITLLTNAATQQGYSPEWFIIGTAGMDTNQFGRRYDQKQVDGHMFGLSQLGSTAKIYGPESEAGKLYKKLNGTEIPPGTTGSLYDYVHVFNLLEAAGPTLTADNIAKGIPGLPPGGAPDYPVGKWSYAKGVDGQPDHTAVDDSREVYWDGSAAPGPDEPDKTKKGAFVEVDGGRRYDLGEWPTTDPAVYPARG